MNAVLLAIAMLMVPLTSLAAVEDYKVIKLEQDVRRLEQQVRDLSRQIMELRRTSGAPVDQIVPPSDREAAAVPATPLWLQVKSWRTVRVGMEELEVIEKLGPPTSTRVDDDGKTRTLFYALEITTGTFLGGSVRLQDRRVTGIEPPVLK